MAVGAGRVRIARRRMTAGAVVVAASAATAWLLTLEEVKAPATPVSTSTAPRRPLAPLVRAQASVAAPSVAAAPVAAAPVAAPPVAEDPRPARPACPVTFVPGLVRGGVAPNATIAVEPEVVRLEALAVDELEREVARELELLARLHRLDVLLTKHPPVRLASLIDRLLERAPGPGGDEARAYRVALVSRLGYFADLPVAEARLVRELLDRDLPRAERAAAIDALARPGHVGPSARPTLEHLAASDLDPELRARARAVLVP